MRVLVVEVTAARPVVACIVVDGERQSVLACPVCRGSSVVVPTDVGRRHFVGLAVPRLNGEIDPRAVLAYVLPMVQHNVGYEACAFVAIGGNHAPQFPFGAEGALLVEVIDGHVAHRVAAVAPAALGNPDELDVGGYLVGLRFEILPGCLGIGVPIEPLHHDTFVVVGPSLCEG